MAKVFIEESTLTEIGNAIRSKKSSSTLIPVPNMASEIMSIGISGMLSLIIKVETGSMVTCSNADGVSYTQTAVNDEVVFEGISFGTWDLVATKNGKTAIKTVEFTNPEYTLVYETLLYNEGDECTSVTGGWVSMASTVDNPIITTRTTDGIDWVQIQSSGSGVYITANTFNLDLFNTIEFQGNWNSHGSGKIIAITEDFSKWSDWTDYTVLATPIEELDWDNEGTNPPADPIQTVDISSLSGNCRFGIGISGTGGTASIVRMANFKLF